MGIFGPSKKEIWEQLSREINGQYIDGGFWTGAKVESKVDNWTIVLDTYAVSTGKTSTTYTRIRAPYINSDCFYFKIYREGIFSEIGKLLGGQDIEVGYEDFDNEFIIKGNDEEKVKQLFSNSNIRRLIQSQPRFRLEVKNDEGFFGSHFPEDTDELYFSVPGIIKNIESLKELFELFGEVLHELCNIGSAYEDTPDVKL